MRVLLAIGDVVTGVAAPEGVGLLLESASEVKVMSPSLVGRIRWLTGEIDESRCIADERLATVLGQLAEQGIAATGVRGDELPRTGFADAVAAFSPDHIVIALSKDEHAAWQRHKLVDHVLADHGLPVTVFVLAMVD
jgi:hypothetical protein